MPHLLIAITGHHPGRNTIDERIRKTWLANQKVDAKFFIGLPVFEPRPDEVSLHVSDDLRCQWLKVRMMIEWAYERKYAHIMKIDNDTYVHVPRLLASGFENYDYVGYSIKAWAVYQGRFRNDWPAYGGTGYCLSRKAMRIILADDNAVLGRQSEDWWVYETLKKHGIEPHHDPRYHPGIQDGPSPTNDFITCHHDAHDRLNRTLRDPGALEEIHRKAIMPQ
jgi:hypothetical protein